VKRFQRSVRAEIACAALILLITAAFTTLTGPPH
jgi:putative copper export protein